VQAARYDNRAGGRVSARLRLITNPGLDPETESGGLVD
jgi:hypothetical protein